jgi:hypothetical protein
VAHDTPHFWNERAGEPLCGTDAGLFRSSANPNDVTCGHCRDLLARATRGEDVERGPLFPPA